MDIQLTNRRDEKGLKWSLISVNVFFIFIGEGVHIYVLKREHKTSNKKHFSLI